jgi:hypothetical protein
MQTPTCRRSPPQAPRGRTGRGLRPALLAALAASLFACSPPPPGSTCALTAAAGVLGSGDTTTITATPNAILTIAAANVTVDKAGTVAPAKITLDNLANGTTTFTAAAVTEDTVSTVGGTLDYTNTGGTFKVALTAVKITVHPKGAKDVSAVSPASEAAGTTIASVTSTLQGPPKWTYVIDLATTTPGLTIDRVVTEFEVVDNNGKAITPSSGTLGATGATPGGFQGVIGGIAMASVTITVTAKDANKGGAATFDVTLSDGRRFSLSSVGPKK